jgi:hypothetical protein
MIEQSSKIASQQHVTLLELLDRLLDKGAMVKGEVLLSVADIDLIYLNLGLLLSSVKSVVAASEQGTMLPWYPVSRQEDFLDGSQPQDALPLVNANSECHSDANETATRTMPATIDDQPDPHPTPRAAVDSRNVEKGLARLVLTLIDLIRKLMEKQAIRRIDAGQLYVEEIERVGDTFLRLDERMEQLKTIFDLEDEDLNLDLGPLGDLL